MYTPYLCLISLLIAPRWAENPSLARALSGFLQMQHRNKPKAAAVPPVCP